MSDGTITEPVITAACAECGDGWQRTGRGEDEVSRVLGECRDHGEAAGRQVTWTVEFGGAQGGAFWDDLRQNMADPEFAAEYGRASAEIAATGKAVQSEHLKQSGPDPAPAVCAVPEPWDSWPAWLKRDGTAGVPHCRPDGAECAYLGMIICAKCGWTDRDEGRVQRARELLEDARGTTEANRGAL